MSRDRTEGESYQFEACFGQLMYELRLSVRRRNRLLSDSLHEILTRNGNNCYAIEDEREYM